MADVSNAGTKGYILLFGFIAFLLFVVLVTYVYYYNFNSIPAVQ